MTDLHIVASLSAAGSLSWAIGHRILAGEVFAINDIPGIGPLDDGKRRMEFLRGLSFEKEGGNWLNRDADAFAPWRQLQARLREKPVNRVVIWAGSNGNDYVFARMACYWLEGTAVGLMLVQVPPVMGHHDIAMYAAEALAPLINEAVLLHAEERSRLAREYEHIASHPGLLRECDEDGVLQFRELSAHDNLLLDSCSRRWKPATRVIGEAMGRSDPRNGLGDLFLSGRLAHLIVSGDIEADAPRTSMRAFRVRRSADR